MRFLHQPNDLKLVWAKMPHSWSPPATVTFF
jgi:hypothetical protein